MTLTIICSWCRVVLQAGTLSAPISHTICAQCAKAFEVEA